MGYFIGNIEIPDILIGDEEVVSVFSGPDLVWNRGQSTGESGSINYSLASNVSGSFNPTSYSGINQGVIVNYQGVLTADRGYGFPGRVTTLNVSGSFTIPEGGGVITVDLTSNTVSLLAGVHSFVNSDMLSSGDAPNGTGTFRKWYYFDNLNHNGFNIFHNEVGADDFEPNPATLTYDSTTGYYFTDIAFQTPNTNTNINISDTYDIRDGSTVIRPSLDSQVGNSNFLRLGSLIGLGDLSYQYLNVSNLSGGNATITGVIQNVGDATYTFTSEDGFGIYETAQEGMGGATGFNPVANGNASNSLLFSDSETSISAGETLTFTLTTSNLSEDTEYSVAFFNDGIRTDFRFVTGGGRPSVVRFRSGI